MDRKELLMEAAERKPAVDREVLSKQLDKGSALATMKDSRGYKILYEDFISKKIQESRFLGCAREDLEDTRAEIRVLREMLNFIDLSIKVANEAAEKLKE
jgi:hypothetical protein